MEVSEFLMATTFGILVAAIAVAVVGTMFTPRPKSFEEIAVLMCAAGIWIETVALAIEGWKMRKVYGK